MQMHMTRNESIYTSEVSHCKIHYPTDSEWELVMPGVVGASRVEGEGGHEEEGRTQQGRQDSDLEAKLLLLLSFSFPVVVGFTVGMWEPSSPRSLHFSHSSKKALKASTQYLAASATVMPSTSPCGYDSLVWSPLSTAASCTSSSWNSDSGACSAAAVRRSFTGSGRVTACTASSSVPCLSVPSYTLATDEQVLVTYVGSRCAACRA